MNKERFLSRVGRGLGSICLLVSLESAALNESSPTCFRLPVDGGRYWESFLAGFHPALDIIIKEGAPIFASAKGRVVGIQQFSLGDLVRGEDELYHFPNGISFNTVREAEAFIRAEAEKTSGGLVRNPRKLGKFVVIAHGNSYTVYGHMGRIFVGQGDEVGMGEPIGTVGETGKLNPPRTPHLHFEIHLAGVPVNPVGVFCPDQPPTSITTTR